MRADILERYLRELAHVRGMAEEFAAEQPKIAGRLRLGEADVRDPLVERLLEGFAFVASRIQGQLDAEFPRFTQHLLEMAFPGYLAPLPACGVVRLTPRHEAPSLGSGVSVPRGTRLTAMVPRVWRTVTSDEKAPCEFRTVQDVTLWPLRISSAAVFARTELPVGRARAGRSSRGGLRIRLETTHGLPLSRLACDTLTLHFEGADPHVGGLLLDAVLGTATGLLLFEGTPAQLVGELPAEAVEPIGFSDDEAVLPRTIGASSGLRLLQEFFAYRARFNFVRLRGLARILSGVSGSSCELVIPFERPPSTLEGQVDASCLSLHATPIVNLFECDTDRFAAPPHRFEHHVVVNRSRPFDCEVHSIEMLEGIENETGVVKRFVPFFGAEAAWARTSADRLDSFTVRRESHGDARDGTHLAGDRRGGARSDYEGHEVYVSLAGPHGAPYGGSIRELRARVRATNRDLPLLLPRGAINAVGLETDAPVREVVLATPLTRPAIRHVDGDAAWRLVALLQPNYLSLFGEGQSPESAAAALRGMLALNASADDDSARSLIDAVRRVKVEPRFSRLPRPGPIVFGRGLGVEVTVEDDVFAGGGRYLFATVLQQFLCRYVSINSYVELTLRSESQPSATPWTRAAGSRPVA